MLKSRRLFSESKPKPAQNASDIRFGNLLTKNALNFPAVKLDRIAVEIARDCVAVCSEFAACACQYQLRHSIAGQRSGSPIRTPLEAV
jgi:hypothetical protein